MKLSKLSWAGLATLALLVVAPLTAHWVVGCRAKLVPPAAEQPPGQLEPHGPDLMTFGASYALRRGKLLEVRLVGTATQIGYAHARLLREGMMEVEGALYGRFQELISWSLARTLLLDVAQHRYRTIDRSISDARKRELAALALGYPPDPYADLFEAYQRLVYLHALYDISLAFEHSPLLGCTSFVLSGDAAAGDGALLARAFDFDVHDVFDERKTIFLVQETGTIPFASVAWPGLTGVVSGMNAKGLAVVVHGARAGEPRRAGEPVGFALRRILATCHNAEEAVAALVAREAMISHIVIITDQQGRSAAVERLPGTSVHTRWLGPRAAVTNHFEGPAATDPRNRRVLRETSTLARRQRANELLRQLDSPASIDDAVALLRDRRGAGEKKLPQMQGPLLAPFRTAGIPEPPERPGQTFLPGRRMFILQRHRLSRQGTIQRPNIIPHQYVPLLSPSR